MLVTYDDLKQFENSIKESHSKRNYLLIMNNAIKLMNEKIIKKEIGIVNSKVIYSNVCLINECINRCLIPLGDFALFKHAIEHSLIDFTKQMLI